jgi:hypothetical protein
MQKKKQIPGTIVVVEWIDALTLDQWSDIKFRIEEHKEPVVVLTVGIVLQHIDDYIVLARSIQLRGNSTEGSFQIPSGMIQSIKKLNYPLVTIDTN